MFSHLIKFAKTSKNLRVTILTLLFCALSFCFGLNHFGSHCSGLSPAQAETRHFEDDPAFTGDPQVFNIHVLGQKIDNLETTIKFTEEDLIDGKILITGEAATDAGTIETVEATLNEGKIFQRAQGKNRWRFAFVPQDGEKYEFSARATDSTGSSSYFDDCPTITIKYSKYTTQQEVSRWFKAFRESYIMEDLKKCMDLISPEYTEGYATFKAELKKEFDTAENLNLNLYLTNLTENEPEDEVIVSFSFNKNLNGQASRGQSKIVLQEEKTSKGYQWKMVSLSGDRFAGTE
jgi:hypothetical protein